MPRVLSTPRFTEERGSAIDLAEVPQTTGVLEDDVVGIRIVDALGDPVERVLDPRPSAGEDGVDTFSVIRNEHCTSEQLLS